MTSKESLDAATGSVRLHGSDGGHGPILSLLFLKPQCENVRYRMSDVRFPEMSDFRLLISLKLACCPRFDSCAPAHLKLAPYQLARCFPRSFTFYVAFPQNSIRPLGLPIYVARVPAGSILAPALVAWSEWDKRHRRSALDYSACTPSSKRSTSSGVV